MSTPEPTIERTGTSIDIYGVGGYTKDSPYYINAGEVRTAREALDWLAHVSCKTWLQSESSRHQLARTLADVLEENAG